MRPLNPSDRSGKWALSVEGAHAIDDVIDHILKRIYSKRGILGLVLTVVVIVVVLRLMGVL